MRNIAIVIALMFGLGFAYIVITSKPQPEFYIDGVPYQTIRSCVKSETTMGYSVLWKRMVMTNRCTEYRIDTVEIKLQN